MPEGNLFDSVRSWPAKAVVNTDTVVFFSPDQHLSKPEDRVPVFQYVNILQDRLHNNGSTLNTTELCT